ncbi:Stc1 domain-containing protein [Chaetomium tenue]|uniref:Stc1 domain-containing protein n=1 Tax=Chaetomium tenue TaxID=1854479 RepID=A0ACB7NXH3_9PEZI|nr:Stc1 domain-containing protein [Chaetomium globosum]
MAPQRLRCQQGEWKTRDQFSNRQLAKYDKETRYGKATPSKSGIRCTEHSGAPTNEVLCKGPCRRKRDRQCFSKRTIQHETFWCVECTEWKLRMEIGESLPAPGAQLSVEEARPGNNSSFGNYDASLDDVESTVGTEDTCSVVMSATGTSESILETKSVQYGNWSDGLIPQRLTQVQTRPPHWLIPIPDGALTESMQMETSTADNTSVVGSDMTSTKGGAGRAPVSFNAWGPNGEYARMNKTPTVASGSTRTVTTAHRESVRENKSGWAKVPTRKHAPQLPSYLKSETAGADSGPSRRSG